MWLSVFSSSRLLHTLLVYGPTPSFYPVSFVSVSSYAIEPQPHTSRTDFFPSFCHKITLLLNRILSFNLPPSPTTCLLCSLNCAVWIFPFQSPPRKIILLSPVKPCSPPGLPSRFPYPSRHQFLSTPTANTLLPRFLKMVKDFVTLTLSVTVWIILDFHFYF